VKSHTIRPPSSPVLRSHGRAGASDARSATLCWLGRESRAEPAPTPQQTTVLQGGRREQGRQRPRGVRRRSSLIASPRGLAMRLVRYILVAATAVIVGGMALRSLPRLRTSSSGRRSKASRCRT
jgi:hypothetical protein